MPFLTQQVHEHCHHPERSPQRAHVTPVRDDPGRWTHVDGHLCLKQVQVDTKCPTELCYCPPSSAQMDHRNFLLSYRGSNIRFSSTVIILRGVLNVLMYLLLLFIALHLFLSFCLSLSCLCWDVLFELSVFPSFCAPALPSQVVSGRLHVSSVT